MAQMALASWLYDNARNGNAKGSQGNVQAQSDTRPLSVRQARHLALPTGAVLPSARLVEAVRQLLLIVLTFGILREPSLLHAPLLCEQLAYAPKSGSSEHAKESRQIDVWDEKSHRQAANADEQKYNPWTRAPVVLRLDDNRMPNADGEKSHQSNNDASEVHVFFLNRAAKVR